MSSNFQSGLRFIQFFITFKPNSSIEILNRCKTWLISNKHYNSERFYAGIILYKLNVINKLEIIRIVMDVIENSGSNSCPLLVEWALWKTLANLLGPKPLLYYCKTVVTIFQNMISSNKFLTYPPPPLPLISQVRKISIVQIQRMN